MGLNHAEPEKTVLLSVLLISNVRVDESSTIHSSSHRFDSIDSTIQQLCLYMEKSPMWGFTQNQENPRQIKYLMLDLLSRVASHAPGALVGYYQYGVAYSLLGPLAALALWDVGTSVGNYMCPERIAPDSPSQGYLIDSLGIAYQGIYGLAVAGDSAARFGAGLMIPTLFALKYLTRS